VGGVVGVTPQNDYFSCFLISFYCLRSHTHTRAVGNFHNNAALGVAVAASAATSRTKANPTTTHPSTGGRRRKAAASRALPSRAATSAAASALSALDFIDFRSPRPPPFGLFRLLAATSAPLEN